MREFEFRAKQRSTLKWVYGYLYQHTHYSATHEVIGDYWHIIQPDSDVTIEEGTIGQYTGIKDKNGKKIFEGDIIKVVSTYPDGSVIEYIRQVEWAEDRWYPFANDDFEYGDWWEQLTKNCEVIGNIYDNPELLQGE